MIAPALLDYDRNISDNAHIIGPLIATFSLIAVWECTRNVRFLNLPLAFWLLLAPWILNYENSIATVHDSAVALAIVLLSFVRPRRKHRFGGGWAAVWRSDTPHSKQARKPQDQAASGQ